MELMEVTGVLRVDYTSKVGNRLVSHFGMSFIQGHGNVIMISFQGSRRRRFVYPLCCIF